MTKTQKANLPAIASEAPRGSEHAAGRTSPPQKAIKSLLTGVWRLRTLDGVAPGSRFLWLEVSDV